jgi:hypothetical protein
VYYKCLGSECAGEAKQQIGELAHWPAASQPEHTYLAERAQGIHDSFASAWKSQEQDNAGSDSEMLDNALMPNGLQIACLKSMVQYLNRFFALVQVPELVVTQVYFHFEAPDRVEHLVPRKKTDFVLLLATVSGATAAQAMFILVHKRCKHFTNTVWDAATILYLMRPCFSVGNDIQHRNLVGETALEFCKLR